MGGKEERVGVSYLGPLLFALIHVSAWKGRSPNSGCSILHTGTLSSDLGRVEDEPRHTGDHNVWWWRIDMHGPGCAVSALPRVSPPGALRAWHELLQR